MLTLLLAVALVGPPAPVERQVAQVRGYDARDAHRDAWKACGMTALDLGTTEAIIARGGRELVPIFRNRAVRVGVGALGCWGLHHVASNDPGKARTWSRIGLIARGLAVTWNTVDLFRPPNKTIHEVGR
jgi:hypothetical protein